MKQVSNIIDIIYLKDTVLMQNRLWPQKTCVPPLAPLPVSSKAWPNNMEIIIPILGIAVWRGSIPRTLTLNHANPQHLRPFSSHPFLHPTSINSKKRILTQLSKYVHSLYRSIHLLQIPLKRTFPIQIIWLSPYIPTIFRPQAKPQGRTL